LIHAIYAYIYNPKTFQTGHTFIRLTLQVPTYCCDNFRNAILWLNLIHFARIYSSVHQFCEHLFEGTSLFPSSRTVVLKPSVETT